MQKVVKSLPVSLPPENNSLAKEVDALRAQLKDAEQCTAVADALAEECGKYLDDLRRLLPAPDQKPRHSWFLWRKRDNHDQEQTLKITVMHLLAEPPFASCSLKLFYTSFA